MRCPGCDRRVGYTDLQAWILDVEAVPVTSRRWHDACARGMGPAPRLRLSDAFRFFRERDAAPLAAVKALAVVAGFKHVRLGREGHTLCPPPPPPVDVALRHRPVGFLAATAALSAVALAGCASTPRVGQHARPPQRGPQLHVKASRVFAFQPASITVRGELEGGEDAEDFYCPAQLWTWGDGSESVRESDCPPWTPGTVIARRYSMEHCYCAGDYTPSLTLSRAGRVLARQHASVSIRWAAGGCRC